MLRPIIVVCGIVLAAVGGVIAYRAIFLEPSAAFVVSNEGVREIPNTFRIIEGLALLIIGAVIAFFAAVRRGRAS
ncbi:MAG TPA: hypothetical protein VIW64_01990 [Pyrinomonadaceae bacterium]|jgi:hypothetical protein